ncbi:MAG: branched-chain amino acid ABC transporter permease [Desulfobulbaceae bacterium]|nr:MAG: branched-chain amino acid ABC transporter permease [Desulfobulbaceae bacterium]
MDLKKITSIALLITLVVGIQLTTQLTGTSYYLTQLTMTMYSCLLIIGLCLVMGYAGQISLGHAGFFAIGGYTSAALTTTNLLEALERGSGCVGLLNKMGLLVSSTSLFGEPMLTVHPWLACLLAIALTVLVAFAIGIPVLKLKGHYLAMATLGFGIIIYRIVLAVAFLGEADGISDVPGFTLLPGLTVNGDIGNRITNYYIAATILIIGFVLLLNLIDSRVGRALRAIHGAEDAADAMGINTARYKLYTFVISAVFAAVAGILLTHYTGGISPGDAGVMKSVRYVAIVAIGGMASLWGALSMGGLLNFLSLRGFFGSYDDAFFGAILILIMLFAPQGILRLSLWNKFKGGKKEVQ